MTIEAVAEAAGVGKPAIVSEYDPNRVFALRMLEGPLPIHARITFDPTEHGTRLQLDAHGQPSGLMRLAQSVLRLTLNRQFACGQVTLHATGRLQVK